MSLMRAFTTRRNKSDELKAPVHIGRAASQRAGKPIHRAQISSPVALISTTNPLSYDAPDIAGTVPIQTRTVSTVSTDSTDSVSSCASFHTAEDSDTSALSINTNTDASSVENSPISSEPEPNHLSCYFKPNVDTTSPSRSPSISGHASFDAPQIPQRVPSHSKKAHEHVHRKRSVQRMISPPASIARRQSADMFTVEAPKENPFFNELAQLDEAAEEMSHTVRNAENEADLDYMKLHGLVHFSASDYMTEIHTLLYEEYLAEPLVWI